MVGTVGITVPFASRPSARIVALRDPFTAWLWLIALGLSIIAACVRADAFRSSFGATAPPFLTLALVLVAGIAADRVGLFGWVARVVVPARASAEFALAGVLTVTAIVSGLVNLDVAVVVSVPLALAVASSRHLSAPWMVIGVALTANATSFLLPTSNITNLLVLGTSVPPFSTYIEVTWLGWLLVTIATVTILSVVISRVSNGGAYTRSEQRASLRMIADLAPSFVIAVAIRMLLGTGLVLHGGFFEQLVAGSALAAGVNNLPAAAAVHVVGGTALWAAVLAMAIGPNLLMTGSLAAVISRRIARESGATFSMVQFSALGLLVTPVQLAVAVIGLKLTGAI